MERKSKYSLFPLPPSTPPREPLPPLPDSCLPPLPHTHSRPAPRQKTAPVPSRDISPAPPQQPLASPTEENPSLWPPLNNSWSSREEKASTLKEEGPRVEATSAERKMHTPTPSASSSESSLHKPTFTSPPPPPQNPSNRPRTVYFHSGIGGAGNYHKAIREDNVLRPMTGSRAHQPRFLSSLFGTLGGKKGRRQQQQYDGSEGTGSSHSSSNALPLGAAEVMRRKMLGLASDGKAKEYSTRG